MNRRESWLNHFVKFRSIISKGFESLYLSVFKSRTIQLNCWIELNRQTVKKRNLGDELNYYLLSALTGKKLVNRLNTFSVISNRFTNYICIGSLIEEFSTPQSVVWGAGAIEGGSHPMRSHPKKILAVRGKLTREYLLDNNIDCPEVYGDPALLLPLIYYPLTNTPVGIGIIPHVSEINHPAVRQLVAQGIKLIRLDSYERWTDVIDEIRSCELIISSSLHGLIISDVYTVPNIWISITGALLGGSFKFMDYFSSVGRIESTPMQINESTEIDEIRKEQNRYKPICFNPYHLINSAPWPLKFDKSIIKHVKSYSQYSNSCL